MAAILLALAAAGCGGGDSGEALAKGVAPVCREALPERVIDGGADGFHRIDGVAWGPDGRLYVVDGGGHRLIAYDGAGRELWRRGREGVGPAEFRRPIGLVVHAGRVVMHDTGNQRLTFWTPDGEPAETVPVADYPIPGFPSWVAPFSGGRVVAMGTPRFGSAPGEEIPATLAIVARGAPRVDTIAAFTMVLPQRPYAPETSFAVAADAIYLDRAGTYEIERYDARGRRTGVLRGPAKRPVLDAKEREKALASLPEGVDPSDVEIPAEIPIVAKMRTTGEGDLLVWTHWQTADLQRVDRWSRDGRYAGSMMIPRGLLFTSLRGDRLAAVRADSVEPQAVRLFRIGGETVCPGPLPGG